MPPPVTRKRAFTRRIVSQQSHLDLSEFGVSASQGTRKWSTTDSDTLAPEPARKLRRVSEGMGSTAPAHKGGNATSSDPPKAAAKKRLSEGMGSTAPARKGGNATSSDPPKTAAKKRLSEGMGNGAGRVVPDVGSDREDDPSSDGIEGNCHASEWSLSSYDGHPGSETEEHSSQLESEGGLVRAGM